MEHLNRTLKDYLLGLGANISESTIIQISRSLRKLMAITGHFDSVCGIHKESIYHTCMDARRDLQLVIDELQNRKCLTTFLGATTRYFRTSSHTSQHMLTSINYSTGYKGIKKRFQIVLNFETFYTN